MDHTEYIPNLQHSWDKQTRHRVLESQGNCQVAIPATQLWSRPQDHRQHQGILFGPPGSGVVYEFTTFTFDNLLNQTPASIALSTYECFFWIEVPSRLKTTGFPVSHGFPMGFPSKKWPRLGDPPRCWTARPAGTWWLWPSPAAPGSASPAPWRRRDEPRHCPASPGHPRLSSGCGKMGDDGGWVRFCWIFLKGIFEDLKWPKRFYSCSILWGTHSWRNLIKLQELWQLNENKRHSDRHSNSHLKI